jgi:hypothetical protein
MKAAHFDHVLNALKLLKTRTLAALIHMAAVGAKDEYNNGKRVKSAVMFTEDHKSTIKVTRIGDPKKQGVSLVVSIGRPAYADKHSKALPSGIILRYSKKKIK